MPTAYQDCSPEELLEALEQAGRHPDEDLLAMCLEHAEVLTPGLLALLESGVDEDWAEDDPRWYREIHAGLLLIKLREEQALPLFDAIMRDPDRELTLMEWFESDIATYGPALIPWLTRLAQDEKAINTGRITAITTIGQVVEAYPEEREQVLPALRGLLPPLQEDGTLDLPDTPEALPDEDIERWSWTVHVLMELEDQKTRSHVLALYSAHLLNDWIIGGPQDYLEAIGESPLSPESRAFLETYVEPKRVTEQRKQLQDLAAMLEMMTAAEQRKEAEPEPAPASVPRLKIGRNERVTIRNPETGETQTRKYKHAQKLLDQGWQLIETAD